MEEEEERKKLEPIDSNQGMAAAFAGGAVKSFTGLNPLDFERMAELMESNDDVVAEADSALHLALTHRAALNVDIILEKMAKAVASDYVKDATLHYKDIIHELVDYKEFKGYLDSLT